MNEEAEARKKKKKETIKRIQKEKERNHAFQCIKKCTERGSNGSLKIIHVKNEEGKIMKTSAKINKVEEEITKCNK